MDDTVSQLRKLLKLAAQLRSFAADASQPDYARKLLSAAAELEVRAEFLSGQKTDIDPDEEDGALHRPIDIRI
jgi:hypothetical protein